MGLKIKLAHINIDLGGKNLKIKVPSFTPDSTGTKVKIPPTPTIPYSKKYTTA